MPNPAAATYAQLARLCAESPVRRIAPGLWFVTGHREAVRVLRDERRFPVLRRDLPERSTPNLFHAPAEDHGRRRRIMAFALTPTRVAALAATAQEIAGAVARACAERCAATASADLVSEFADPLTSRVVAEFVGIPPHERDHVFGLVRTLQKEAFTRARGDESSSEAGQAFRAWALDAVAYRRGSSERRAEMDAIDTLLGVDPATGRGLTDEELVVDIRQLCRSGLGGTRRLVANLFYELAVVPERYRRLRTDPTLVPAAIEESLRHDAPTKLAQRACVTATEIAGTTIAAGDDVIVSLASINRDEHRYPNAERFDLDRSCPRPHLAFGWGVHRCPGTALARLVATAGLRAMLDEVAEISLAEGYAYTPPTSLDAFLFTVPASVAVVLRRDWSLHSPPAGVS